MSVSREIGCTPSVQKPWGPDGQVSTRPVRQSEKGERGRAPVMRSADRQSKTPRRGKPKGAPTRTIRLNPGPAGGLWVVCTLPVGEVAAVTSRPKTRGQRRSKERTAPSRDQGPEGKPQERDRDETGPAGCGGSKASRGCKTLWAQHDRWDGSRRSDVAPRSWQNAEGERTSDGAWWVIAVRAAVAEPRRIVPVKL